MILGLTQIIAVVTVILLLIFSLLTFVLKKENSRSNIFLSAFLFSNSLFIIEYLILASGTTLNISLTELLGIGYGFGFLFGPLLYFYTRSITANETKFILSTVWHFIPFVVYFCFFLLGIKLSWQLKDGILHLQIIPYMIACLILIFKFRREIGEYFASLEKLNLNWLIYVVGGFLLMWLIDFTAFLIIILDSTLVITYRFLTFISILINLIFIVLLFYKALQHPQYLVKIIEANNTQKYESSKLSNEEKEDILNKILHYFESEKPYLNPVLNIQDVANTIGINIKNISQVINELLNKNFHDLVNSYRITEAKYKLKNQLEREKTILEILYDSGFNSKTTFNTTFKKHTGLTPTEYRYQNSQS